MGASKLTSKFQATIPTDVREQLGLKSGDIIVFRLKDGAVVLEKATPLDRDFARYISATLSEWDSDEDEEAYRDLQKI